MHHMRDGASRWCQTCNAFDTNLALGCGTVGQTLSTLLWTSDSEEALLCMCS